MSSVARVSDAWDPQQYHRFQAERSQPFFDLLALVEPVPGGRVVDLGCGSGELTARLHEHTRAAETVGIDSSPAMLAAAAAHAADGLRFEAGDIGSFAAHDRVDVVFANASLQWVPDHRAVLARWTDALAPGGQLAVQVPANADHASHTLSAALADEEPYRAAMGGAPPADPVRSVLAPEAYAKVLYDLGYEEQTVRLQVYGHVLGSAGEVVEWVKGTSLTRFQRALPDDLFERFVAEYRRRLLAELGPAAPYFYAFKRVLFRARRGRKAHA